MSISLLPWQEICLNVFKENNQKRDFVVIAGTGTGKTTAASAMALHAFRDIASRKSEAMKEPLIMVFCPYRSIKMGWKKTLEKMGLFVAVKPQEIAPDREAIISTYAGANEMLKSVTDLIGKRELIFVFDEFHHLEENNTWAAPFVNGSYKPRKNIFLSGTPWREDGSLPETLVPYNGDEVVADFTHTYGENVNLLAEDGCNTTSVRFEPMEMEVTIETTYDDGRSPTTEVIDTKTSRRSDSISPFVRFESYNMLMKRTQITKMIDEGVETLSKMRRSGAMPTAGGIIFVSGKQEGKAVKTYLMAHHEIDALFVTSDDPLSHDQIEKFRDSSDEWIVAIDMIAEGTDIPRLNVAIDLSFKLTLMHIIQRWGRVLRLHRKKDYSLEKNTDAVIYFINHAQLGYVAKNIEDEVKRNKREKTNAGVDAPPKSNSTKRPIAENGDFSEAIFKGKKLDQQVNELAAWLKDTNYGAKCAGVGYAVVLVMAETFIATDTIPVEFFKQPEPTSPKPGEEAISKRAEFQSAVDEYTSITSHIAYTFFNGEFSIAQKMVNAEMGIHSFTSKKATLAAVKHRVEAAKAVRERLTQEASNE